MLDMNEKYQYHKYFTGILCAEYSITLGLHDGSQVLLVMRDKSKCSSRQPFAIPIYTLNLNQETRAQSLVLGHLLHVFHSGMVALPLLQRQWRRQTLIAWSKMRNCEIATELQSLQ